jgi:hypothetical protein
MLNPGSLFICQGPQDSRVIIFTQGNNKPRLDLFRVCFFRFSKLCLRCDVNQLVKIMWVDSTGLLVSLLVLYPSFCTFAQQHGTQIPVTAPGCWRPQCRWTQWYGRSPRCLRYSPAAWRSQQPFLGAGDRSTGDYALWRVSSQEFPCMCNGPAAWMS